MIKACNQCGVIILRQIIEAGVPALCPACGPVYSIAKKVSSSPNISPEAHNVANLVCGGLMFFAALVLIENLTDALKN